MAKAAFWVNHLRVIDKGEYLVIEGKRACQHGQMIDHVLVTVPAELKGVLQGCGEDTAHEEPTSDPKPPGVTNRMEKYFRGN